MKSKILLLWLVLFISHHITKAQPCTTLGQNPSTAFPVCGTSSFAQSSVPICGDRAVPCPCSGSLFTDKNPFWYKFTCFGAGTLGFVIAPNTSSDDYDWQLFDVTGQNPDAVYTNPSLFVACNWSGDGGNTGASSAGTSLIRCEGPGVPTFSSMPTLTVGHDYLLLVSHFTNSQAGYSLSFGGGTANITDPTDPHLLSSRAACDGTQGTIKLNKRMKCSSLSTNGSEFSITPAVANVIAASGYNCTGGFDMDSLILTFSAPLPPGNYTITINNGTDGNTLKDNCDRLVPVGETIPMIVYPIIPTPMDSISPVGCAPDEVQLVFRKNIRCTSIAADGSDFFVTGPTPVNVISATGSCNNNLSPVIKVKFAAPVQTGGVYQIHLQTGTDGNTVIDECGQETPPPAVVNFVTKDTVNADFTFSIRFGCKKDTIDYVHPGGNGVNKWLWNFDNNRTSTLQNPSLVYSTFGQKVAQLTVSNGVCTATTQIDFKLDSPVTALFEATALVCPKDPAIVLDKSAGRITTWLWDFGNGITSTLQNPPPVFYMPANTIKDYTIKLVVSNGSNCVDSLSKKIKVINNCYIAVPNAFTPNGDGLNDYLYPLNAYKAIDLSFSVYNRFGQLIFYTTDWTNKWDGTYKGAPCDPGTYVWMLMYKEIDTGKKVQLKGTSILIR